MPSIGDTPGQPWGDPEKLASILQAHPVNVPPCDHYKQNFTLC